MFTEDKGLFVVEQLTKVKAAKTVLPRMWIILFDKLIDMDAPRAGRSDVVELHKNSITQLAT